MNDQTTNIRRFLVFIEQRIIEPIEGTNISESCTATLLLIFAAIDSLSKITCSEGEFQEYKKDKKGSKARFTGFLREKMDKNYKGFEKEIYGLRCDIIHTGINAKVILSKDVLNTKHLENVNGYLWINTRQFFIDFKEALERIKNDIISGGPLYQNAKSRLNDFNIISVDGEDIGTPSPGPDNEIF